MARVVLITGGAGGIGRAIAARFLPTATPSMLADRTDERPRPKPPPNWARSRSVTADVTVVDDCERMVAATVDRSAASMCWSALPGFGSRAHRPR